MFKPIFFAIPLVCFVFSACIDEEVLEAEMDSEHEISIDAPITYFNITAEDVLRENNLSPIPPTIPNINIEPRFRFEGQEYPAPFGEQFETPYSVDFNFSSFSSEAENVTFFTLKIYAENRLPFRVETLPYFFIPGDSPVYFKDQPITIEPAEYDANGRLKKHWSGLFISQKFTESTIKDLLNATHVVMDLQMDTDIYLDRVIELDTANTLYFNLATRFGVNINLD